MKEVKNKRSSLRKRSPEQMIDDKLRLALGRGLVAAYADVVRQPIPKRLQVFLRRLALKERGIDPDPDIRRRREHTGIR